MKKTIIKTNLATLILCSSLLLPALPAQAEVADTTTAQEAGSAEVSTEAAGSEETTETTQPANLRPSVYIVGEDGIEDVNAEAEQRLLIPAESDSWEDWPAAPQISAEAAVLMDAETGTVLYAKNPHEKLYPASTTKLLTVLLAYENLDLSQPLTFSYSAVHDVPWDGSNMGMDAGEVITAEQTMYGVMVASANEGASALAEAVAGSVTDFAQLMNARALQLGCQDTHFTNANGLHAPDHYTTAYDLALIARAYFSHDILSKIAGTARYHIEPTATQPDDIWMNSTNYFLNGELQLEGMIGGKTGYTSQARSCLVTCAEKNGRKLICAIMREEPPAQYLDTATLMNYGAQSFRALYDTASIGGFHAATGDLFSIRSSLPVILPAAADDSEIEASVRYLAAPEPVASSEQSSADPALTQESHADPATQPGSATLPQGARKIGEIIYSFHGKEIGSADLLFTPAVKSDISSFTATPDVQLPSWANWFARRTGNTIYLHLPHILLSIVGAAAVFILFMLTLSLIGSFNFTTTERARRHSRRHVWNRKARRHRARQLSFRSYDGTDDNDHI